MSQIRRDDRRSIRYTGSSEVNCDLAPVRPTDATWLSTVRCVGNIERSGERCGDEFRRCDMITSTASWVYFSISPKCA